MKIDGSCHAARIAVILLALAGSAPVLALAGECPLAGRWKSDAARTLAEVAAAPGVRREAMNPLSDDLFGHMNHEWTCTELLAWLDDDEPGEPVAYRIVERDSDSLLVTFPGGAENDLRVVFEGECYKIQSQHQDYSEYFCRVRK